MKLAKLSLAAIMAAGALSTANAGSLEDAIKGVDVSGMLRYELNSIDKNDNLSSTNDWDVSVKVTTPVADNLKATAEIATYSQDSSNVTGAYDEKGINFERLYFTYNKDALTVKAGRQALGTPVTDNGLNGMYGNGIVGMYNLGQVTLAGAYFGSSNASAYGTTIETNGADISAVAALGSFGPVSAQVWGIKVAGIVKSLIYSQVDAKFAGASLTALMINTDVYSDKGTYYAVKLAYSINNFGFCATYVDNDKDQGVYAFATDALPVWTGWRLGYEIDNVADTSAWGVAAKGAFGKFSGKIGYAKAEGDAAFGKIREVYGAVNYAYSKNFNTYLKYSDQQGSSGNTLDQQYLRFGAKYTF